MWDEQVQNLQKITELQQGIIDRTEIMYKNSEAVRIATEEKVMLLDKIIEIQESLIRDLKAEVLRLRIKTQW